MPAKTKTVKKGPNNDQRFNRIESELEQIWSVVNAIIQKLNEIEPKITRMADRMGVE